LMFSTSLAEIGKDASHMRNLANLTGSSAKK
jgi:hypothetical protein